MESLAATVAAILAFVFGSGFIALALSFSRKRWLRFTSMVFASIAILTGLTIAGLLFQGNGILIGSVPVALAALSFFNLARLKNKR